MKRHFLKKILAFSLFSSCIVFNIHSGEVIVETETESSGAGAIVFDAAKLPLDGGENAVSLFNYDFGDNNVEFLAEGYWKSLVSSSASCTFGFGNTPSATSPSIAFTQNVDLSLWFMLNRHWYFEAAFADEFTKNTVAAGYVGDGYLKSARISNRGIKFSVDYSISEINRGIGGGEDQSPGISANFSGKNWRADGAVRYDMLEADEKTWYGKNAVTTDEIALSKWNAKNQFALPSSKAVSNVEEIYVENSGGNYTDLKGRKYKKLDSTQYLLVASKNMIVISKDAKIGTKSAVAVKFNTDGKNAFDSEIDDFLSSTDEWFSGVEIGKYTFYGSDKSRLFGEIDGSEVLYIKHPSGFSPFVCAQRYDCGISGATDAAIASKYTETVSKKYGVSIIEDDTLMSENDFFYDSHLYADVYNENSDSSDMAEPSVRFPLADEHPEIYLGLTDKSDLILRVRSYTSVKRYDIGTDAVPGTVRVYKNGILDANAKYDAESGTIELSSAVGSGDKVYATWYKESEDANTGAIAAALGFEYFFTDKLSADAAISSRWTIAEDYADESFSSPGFIAFATGAKYESENAILKNVASVSLESTNTTGKYRILAMDENAGGTSYLSKTAASDLPEDFAPILNLENETIELEKENDGSVPAKEGEKDSSITGYAIPVSWDFSDNLGGSVFWAANSIELSTSSSELASSSQFQIALKNIGEYSGEDFYLQLGVENSTEFDSEEESEKIPTWKISESDEVKIEDADDGWQIITVTMSDEKRSALSSLENANARIVVTSSGNGSGTIFLGPYEIKGSYFLIKSDDSAIVCSTAQKDSTLSASDVRTLNTSSNYVQEIKWKFSGSEKTTEIEASRYFKKAEIKNYSKLNFYFKTEFENAVSEDEFLYGIDDGENFLFFAVDDSDDENAASFSLGHDFVKKLSDGWHSVSIDIDSAKIEIDGAEIPKSECNLKINPDAVPTRFRIKLNPIFQPEEKKFAYKSGKISVDELYLSESNPNFSFQDKFKASYKKNGEIFKIGEKTLAKDFHAKGNATFSSTISTGTKNSEKDADADGEIGLTVAGIVFDASVSKSAEESGVKTASHKVKTEKPIFSLIAFSEEYNFDSDGESLSKTDSLRIGKNAFSLSAQSTAESDNISVNQNAKISLASSFARTTASAVAKVSQKISCSADENERIETENYASSWQESTKMQGDGGRENAQKREIFANAKAEHQLQFLKMKGGISFTTKGNFKNTSSKTFTDASSFLFTLPFSVKNNLLSFSWEKTAGGTENSCGNEKYKDDAKNLAENLVEKNYLFKSIPFHDLFDERISERVFEQIGNETESAYYSTLYSINWKRQQKGAKYDFFVPNNAQFSFERDVKASTSESDLYQAKLKTGTSAFNVFGKDGAFRFFDWYEQDEFTTSFSFAAKIPRNNPGAVSVLVNAYTQSTFYIGEKDYLKAGLETSIEDRNDWSGKATVIWKRNGKSRMMDGIVGMIFPSIDKKKIIHTRTDSMNFSSSCASSTSSSSSPNTRKYSFEYSHMLDSEITKYVTINTSLELDYSATWNKIASVTATLGLGCTVKF